MLKGGFRGLIMALLMAGLLTGGGCGGKGKTGKTPRADPAVMTLSRAAGEVHAEMMTTSLLMRGTNVAPLKSLLPENYDLLVPMELNWLGQAWPAVEKIAEKIGYQAFFYGRRPLSEPAVVLKAKNEDGSVRLVYDHLSDLNFQIHNSGGNLTVDSINRRLILGFSSGK
jgi:hypothetical protein